MDQSIPATSCRNGGSDHSGGSPDRSCHTWTPPCRRGQRQVQACVLGLLLLCVATATNAQVGQATHRLVLDNGLEIVVVENHAAPVSTVLLAVRGGANVQARDQEGLAHLFEHLVFRSYGSGPAAFGAATGNLNGVYNGATDVESVNYYLIVPSHNTEKAVRLLSGLVTRTEFSREDLEEERKVVLDELERGKSDVEETTARRVSQRLWGAAWHRRDVIGDSMSLMRITVDQLRDAYARYYVPNNAAVIVTGDVVPSEVFDAAQHHFGDWRRGADPFERSQLDPIPALAQSEALMFSGAVPDVTIRIGLRGPSLREDTAATYAAHALVGIINDPGSAFQQQLVGSGLFQSMQSSYSTLSEVGSMTFVGKTTDTTAYDALLALIGHIDHLGLLVGVTQEHLAIAMKRLEVNAALAQEATAALAPSLAFWWASAGLDYYLTYRERMNSLTLDDLRRFAERYLINRPEVLGVLGPAATMARITELLRDSPGER
jgi:zinc protease